MEFSRVVCIYIYTIYLFENFSEMNITIILPCVLLFFASLHLYSWCESDISLQYFKSNFQRILRKVDRVRSILRCNLQDLVERFPVLWNSYPLWSSQLDGDMLPVVEAVEQIMLMKIESRSFAL